MENNIEKHYVIGDIEVKPFRRNHRIILPKENVNKTTWQKLSRPDNAYDAGAAWALAFIVGSILHALIFKN